MTRASLACRRFPTEIGMVLKEKSSGMYRLSAYYLARTLSSLPLDLVYPVMFVTIIYWSGGLRPQFQWFLANLCGVLLGVLTAQSIGLLLGAAFVNLQKAQTMCTIIILTFMLVSGFWVRSVPSWMQWLKYLSFSYWCARHASCEQLSLLYASHSRLQASIGPSDSLAAAGVGPYASGCVDDASERW